MGCLFAFLAAGAPRLAFIIYWIARPIMVNAAFGTWIWPLLGFIVAPFATLMYVILYTPGVGLAGWDWFWVGLALVLDIAGAAGSAYSNRAYMTSGGSNGGSSAA